MALIFSVAGSLKIGCNGDGAPLLDSRITLLRRLGLPVVDSYLPVWIAGDDTGMIAVPSGSDRFVAVRKRNIRQ